MRKMLTFYDKKNLTYQLGQSNGVLMLGIHALKYSVNRWDLILSWGVILAKKTIKIRINGFKMHLFIWNLGYPYSKPVKVIHTHLEFPTENKFKWLFFIGKAVFTCNQNFIQPWTSFCSFPKKNISSIPDLWTCKHTVAMTQ